MKSLKIHIELFLLEVVHKMSKIKEEYPNVKEFIERNEIVNFTKKEVKALNEYLKLKLKRGKENVRKS